MSDTFRYYDGDLPLLVSVPHDGRQIPDEVRERMTQSGLDIPDTDWHVAKLYDFVRDMGVKLLVADYSRYVIDLNRSADDESLASANEDEVDTIGEEDLAELKTDGETPKVVQFERKADSYKVIRGDNLWNISGKEKIYNDPFQWLKIYSANREQISNPDVIEIDQVFVIPRTPALNEHWVSRGESLSKIAAQRYSNPFEWTRIYEANKTILESPDLVHPHTILIIPKKNKKKDAVPVNM